MKRVVTQILKGLESLHDSWGRGNFPDLIIGILAAGLSYVLRLIGLAFS